MSNGDESLSAHQLIKALSTPTVSLAMRKAMEAAKVLMPTRPTPLALSKLTDKTLKELGVSDSETRKAIKAAWPLVTTKKGKKQGFKVGPPSPPKKRKGSSGRPDMFEIQDPEAEASSSTLASNLPVSQLDFGEDLDEKKLKANITINRAPIMTAWATVVCLRLGFSKEEALSLASVYTDMNAAAKAVSLGRRARPHGPSLEDELRKPDNTLPYVDLMGRRLPVVEKEDKTWRAIFPSNEICHPSKAAKYLLSSISIHLPPILRSLTLLAESYSPAYLQSEQGGFGLYMLFRPNPPPPPDEVEEQDVERNGKGRAKQTMRWGGKGRMRCEEILALRAGVEGSGVKKEEGEEEEGEKHSTRPRRPSASETKVSCEKEDPEAASEEDEKPTKRLRRASTSTLPAPLSKMKKEERADDDEDEEDLFWGDLKDEDLPDEY